MKFNPLLYPYLCKYIIAFAFVAVHEQLKEQIKGVDAVQSKEVSVFWIGMAEVHICKSRFQNIENMVWNFVPRGLCFACINDYWVLSSSSTSSNMGCSVKYISCLVLGKEN